MLNAARNSYNVHFMTPFELMFLPVYTKNQLRSRKRYHTLRLAVDYVNLACAIVCHSHSSLLNGRFAALCFWCVCVIFIWLSFLRAALQKAHHVYVTRWTARKYCCYDRRTFQQLHPLGIFLLACNVALPRHLCWKHG